MSHVNASVRANNRTISGGSIAHVGQIFFDQALVDTVEKVAPYNTNKADITKNEDDDIMFEGAQGQSDPVVEYVLLGKTVEDGIFAWANFGIDPQSSHTVKAASKCGEGGCIAGPKMEFPPCLPADFMNGKGKKGKGPKGKGKGFPPKGMKMPPICGPDGKPPVGSTPGASPDMAMGPPPLNFMDS